MVFQPVTAGFTDPVKREAAFTRWKLWAENNLPMAVEKMNTRPANSLKLLDDLTPLG